MLNLHNNDLFIIVGAIVLGLVIVVLLSSRGTPEPETREEAINQAFECILENPPFPLTESVAYYKAQMRQEWETIGTDTGIEEFMERINYSYPGCFK